METIFLVKEMDVLYPVRWHMLFIVACARIQLLYLLSPKGTLIITELFSGRNPSISGHTTSWFLNQSGSAACWCIPNSTANASVELPGTPRH